MPSISGSLWSGTLEAFILLLVNKQASKHTAPATTWRGRGRLSKGEGRWQVIRGQDNQRSHLSGVTHVFCRILVIEIDAGICSIVSARIHNRG